MFSLHNLLIFTEKYQTKFYTLFYYENSEQTRTSATLKTLLTVTKNELKNRILMYLVLNQIIVDISERIYKLIMITDDKFRHEKL